MAGQADGNRDFYLGQGSSGHDARVGYVRYVHYLDPAHPALQQADRGVERLAGSDPSYPTTRYRLDGVAVLMGVKANAMS